jgi:carboxyl-terminal processing protease
MYNDSLAIIKPVENILQQEQESRQGIEFICKKRNFWEILSSDSLFQSKGNKGSVVELTIYRKSERKRISKKKLKRMSFKSVDVVCLKAQHYIKSIDLPRQHLRSLRQD